MREELTKYKLNLQRIMSLWIKTYSRFQKLLDIFLLPLFISTNLTITSSSNQKNSKRKVKRWNISSMKIYCWSFSYSGNTESFFKANYTNCVHNDTTSNSTFAIRKHPKFFYGWLKKQHSQLKHNVLMTT